ncbi:hybrid sensor histidine kinase/response regulator transcription factor [Zobellia alginiliquefaciens]|uniref:hybrid sensor histidine kinase/response regulator transcription factor n=1 Tax=Zobellia alginiliquefaciens TaxID=3032586 RepID=UPI0023E4437E|nr:hybrid sensor histidine kinase/response regulator transcription factor [Zobellia alginiliquefaciens]
MRKLLLSCVWLLSILGWHATAQEIKPELDFYKIKDGISQVGIHTITQDNDGFVWIGTHGSGIYRYDGMDYISYKPKDYKSKTFTSNFVYCSYLDAKNRFWVGTNIGLALYDRENDEFRHIPLVNKDNINQGNIGVISLQGDGNGNLYMGTGEQGVFLMDLDTLILEKLPFNNPRSDNYLAVSEIKITDNGTIYAASSGGLLEVDSKNKRVDFALFRDGNRARTITAGLQSLFIDTDGAIWAGSISNGIYKVKLSSENQTPTVENFKVTGNNIFTIAESADGEILLGTENDGLYNLNKNGEVVRHSLFDKNDEKSILSNSVWSLYLDKDSRMWVGFYNRGVVVYDKYYNKFSEIQSIYNKPNSLQISSVTAIVEDDQNRLWIAMEGGGIDVWERSTNTFTHINTGDSAVYKGLTSDYIQTLFIDSQFNIWAGSWDQGLFFLKRGSKQFINYKFPILSDRKGSRAIMSFTEDAKGTVWIGTFNQGLYSFQLKDLNGSNFSDSSFASHQLVNNYINKVVVDAQDTVWVGTTNGLIKMKKDNAGRYEAVIMNHFLQDDPSISYNHYDIVSLFADDNILWAGTRGLGLLRFNISENSALWYDQSNGLSMPNIIGITNDAKGNLWLDGNSGIVRFDRTTKEFTNYTKRDGLVSYDYNKNAVYKDNKGRLYFGGNEGVDYFNPDNINILETPPTVYLKNFKLFNETVLPDNDDSPLNKAFSQTDSITLNSEQSVFTIEYSGISFTRPEENQYAYYLDGYEEDWNYVDEARSATYTNLDAGHYIFKVKAANNDGVWSKTPVTLHIEILPPWWRNNWALFVYFLIILGFLSLLRRFEKKRIIDKQQVENERQKRVREEELHKERIQFFTNVAHEFSSPLTLILNPIKDILSEKDDNYSNRLRLKHLTIYKNTERLIRLINELLDFSKLESDKIKVQASRLNIVPFIKEVSNHFKEEALSNHIDLTVNTENEVIWVWADEGMLEKIVFNLLSNAFKVTPDGGKIVVEIKETDNGIEFKVADTGPGLKEGELEKLFERFYQGEPLNKGYYSGAGIGLELVHSFVKLHKGSVDVKSKLGEGSTFSVILPAGKNHFKASEISITNGKLSSIKPDLVKATIAQESIFPTRTERKAKTLLIVEDDTELRNYLKNEFKGEYKVVVSKNGADGLKLAQEILPDVIITDVIMPEMNGYDFCEAIRSDIKTSHIPVMMLTANAKIDDRISGIERGADVYLVKPFDMKLVRHHLGQLIHSREVIYKKYFKSMGEIQDDASITSLDKAFIEKAINYIHENITSPSLGVESLASHLNLSRSQLYRKTKALTNQTANEFIRNQRLQKAKTLLENGNSDLNDICNLVGFSSTSYFTQRFKDYFGVSPAEIKQENV